MAVGKQSIRVAVAPDGSALGRSCGTSSDVFGRAFMDLPSLRIRQDLPPTCRPRRPHQPRPSAGGPVLLRARPYERFTSDGAAFFCIGPPVLLLRGVAGSLSR